MMCFVLLVKRGVFMTDCFENATFLLRLCMMCFVLSEKRGTFSYKIITDFITETEYVYCAVRTKTLIMI